MIQNYSPCQGLFVRCLGFAVALLVNFLGKLILRVCIPLSFWVRIHPKVEKGSKQNQQLEVARFFDMFRYKASLTKIYVYVCTKICSCLSINLNIRILCTVKYYIDLTRH